MTPPRRNHADDLRGATRLALDATTGVMELVEAMHRTIASGPALLGRPLEGPARVATQLAYGYLRGVATLVGAGLDAALARLGPALGESVPGPEREAVLAALNGVVGDYLAERGNPLAIEMRLRHGGAPLDLDAASLRAAFPEARARVVVLVHGSSLSDVQWLRNGHDHGAALARDLPCTALYLHYNSGLHVSTNGRSLAALLERLVVAWPVDVEALDLVGHSMGGLVVRAACHAGEAEAHGWRRRLKKLVTLATPHHGAPMERGGNHVEFLLGASRYSRPFRRLARLRSAGVTDLRYGNVLDAHWEGRDRFAHGGDPRAVLALPEGVACFAAAATTAAGPRARLPGDGLVPVDSALGRHPRPELTLRFPEANQWLGYGLGHLDLLDRPEVYEVLRGWLAR